MEADEVYKNILIHRDELTKYLLEANEIVKKFIIDKGLIMQGGNVIDYSLRLKGSRLYDENVIPDYDFFSPNHVVDSAELYKIICNTIKNTDINVIKALHQQTLRIRVNFTPVADITYLPKNTFDKIETLTFDGIKIVHPNYQRMDMHLSLFTPFKNRGMEAIFSRYSKDMKRFDMLDEYYKLESTDFEPKYVEIKFPKKIMNDVCFGGFVAFNYFMERTNFKTTYSGKNDFISDNDNVLVKIPEPIIHIYTYHLKETIDTLELIEKNTKRFVFYPFGDKRNTKVIIMCFTDESQNKIEKLYEIYDTEYQLITIVEDKIKYANPQGLFLYLLVKEYEKKLGINEILEKYNYKTNIPYYYFYNILGDLVKTTTDRELFPSINVFGDSNYNDAVMITYINIDNQFNGVQKDITLVPKNMYECKYELSDFDYTKSLIFLIDGMFYSHDEIKHIKLDLL